MMMMMMMMMMMISATARSAMGVDENLFGKPKGQVLRFYVWVLGAPTPESRITFGQHPITLCLL
eukprot:10794337-Karenia_brevis.AAC.1